MRRAYYSSSITDFLAVNPNAIIGELTRAHARNLDQTQLNAWLEQINILKRVLTNHSGRIYFEYAIPRMGKRIDVVLLIGPVIFVLEFKVGESHFTSSALDQVTDYCLDLKNFHNTSLDHIIAPVLIATASRHTKPIVCETRSGAIGRDIDGGSSLGCGSSPTVREGLSDETGALLDSRATAPLATARSPTSLPDDKVLSPITSTVPQLGEVIDRVLRFAANDAEIDADAWERGRYCPTPTIIEAALALYKGHSVDDITRHEADKPDISRTTDALDDIIRASRDGNFKSICFVTGVPGAGKTLIGLNIANKHRDTEDGLHSVFLSGNGPLVAILREALARDHVENEKAQERKVTKTEARRKVSSFIQNVHHFRDECIRDPGPPIEHVALFDEAQRAWNLQQTSNFMRQKKNVANFNVSEPEFLISCMDRHPDWAVVVCLVGGGQEINIGEAGISEWFAALNRSFPHWHVYISSQLTDAEYASGLLMDVNDAPDLDGNGHNNRSVTESSSKVANESNAVGARGSGSDPVVVTLRTTLEFKDELHLAVSMRSFRAENVSLLVKQILDLDTEGARRTLSELGDKYPIVITRDLAKAKQWLRSQARGSERYGIVVSSQAERLKPHAIDVRTKVNPVHWFLNDKADVRSSYYLEDVATEFSVQGLELDWVCVTWDADFRHSSRGWQHWKFHGSRWMRINKSNRQVYLKNAYRVLLTRARQGMVVVVPSGDAIDQTRKADFYDLTFAYLKEIGFDNL
jgi:hypothetical protein